MADDWQPVASRESLARRAELLRSIRRFMDERSILEVETPVLSRAGATDPNIRNLATTAHPPGAPDGTPLYLHTSPEFAMKRLLAAGVGPIYQITRVFRDAELGRLHQLEFTMLVWYRPGFDHHAMMDEVRELIAGLGLEIEERVAYLDAFESAVGLDPHDLGDVTEEQLARIIGDMASLAVKLNKPLSARLMPVAGKKAGDRTEFNDPSLVNTLLQALP